MYSAGVLHAFQSLMKSLNSREVAVTFWTTALVIGALSVKGVREPAWAVVKQAFLSKLVLVWITLAVYSALLIVALGSVGLWTVDMLKDTLIWFVFSAVAYPFQFYDPEKEPRIFNVLIRDSLSLLIVVEVLIGTYTFSLPAEIVIVPAVTVIALLSAFAATRDEFKRTASLLGAVQALVGFVLIATVISRAVGDQEHKFIPALLSSLIVVILSIACWPYIVFLRLAFAHEGMLWRIGWKQDNVTRTFKHYAAFRILRHLKFRTSEVAPFIRRNAFKLDGVIDRATLAELLSSDGNRQAKPVASHASSARGAPTPGVAGDSPLVMNTGRLHDASVTVSATVNGAADRA